MNSDVDLKLASPRENISFIAAKRDFRLMISPEFAHWPALKMQSTSQLFDTLLEQGTIVPGGLTEHRLLEGPQWPRSCPHPPRLSRRLARPLDRRPLPASGSRLQRAVSSRRPADTRHPRRRAGLRCRAADVGIFWRCAYASINEADALDGLALLRRNHDQNKSSPPRNDSRKPNNEPADRAAISRGARFGLNTPTASRRRRATW